MKFLDKLRKNKDGFIKENVTIARVGSMDYLGSELGMGLRDNSINPVFVTEDELFSQETIDSIEGVDITFQHPDSLEITLNDWKDLSVGHVQNVYRDGDYLKGTIFVKDADTIKLIEEQGIKEVSLGYDSEIIKKDGKLIKTNIRANHLAIVPQGRCGSACKIGDSKEGIKPMAVKKPVTTKVADAIALMFGGKTSGQKALARKFGDAKKANVSAVKKLNDASESLQKKLADFEEVSVNPDATPEQKAAVVQEIQTEALDMVKEAVAAIEQSQDVVSEIEEEVKDVVAVGDAALPEGVSIPEELKGYVSELEAEVTAANERADSAEAALDEANAKIADLEAELAKLKGEGETATAVADAAMRFPKIKVGDAKTVRQVQEAVLKAKGIYNDAQLKTLTDCAIGSAYQTLVVQDGKRENTFGKKLVANDSAPKSRVSQLGGKK